MMSALLMTAFLAIPVGFALVALMRLGAGEPKPAPVPVRVKRRD